jgi:hypothetical protein
MRLKHGEYSVHHPSSRRQLKLPDHLWEAPKFFNQHLGHHWPKRHAEPSHDRADGPSELGQVLNVPLVGLLRIALGIPGLVQCNRILLPSYP